MIAGQNQLRALGAGTPSTVSAEREMDRHLRAGMIVVGVLVFGLGGVAATVPMAGAVVATGEVTVESHVKRIGHPTGGVIADLYVQDGDHVRKGQVLMRLDNTVSGAAATMTGESLDQLLAREARLTAERDGSSSISFPATLTARAGDPAVAALMSEERRVFALRRAARLGQIAQLNQRIAQSNAEIAGYDAQATAYHDQAGLIDPELAAQRELWRQHYTTLQRLNALERSAVSLRGSEAGAQTSAAQARAKISEVRENILALNQDARSQASTELSEVEGKLSEMRREKVTAEDASTRSAIRAPQDGVVDKLAYTTVGGVVPANETILEIVPDSDRMVVNTRIKVSDIDKVHEGESAALRFSAFNMRTTPEIFGTVDRVSADRATDERTGASWYTARVSIPPEQLRRLGDLKLKPGMPVEAFIQTGERTMLNYIVKPLRDQLERAFRES